MGRTAGIVVANHSAELDSLQNTKANLVYFARSAHAAGILEGLRHYGFLTDGEAPAVKEEEAAVGVS